MTSEPGDEQKKPVAISSTVGEAVYWLIFLLFLPAILSALALEGLLQPVQTMLDKILGFLPNILTAAGADRLSERAGLGKALGNQRHSGLVGLVVYIVILIPVIVAARNALQLEAVASPASNMLNLILESLPSIFAAAPAIAISYVVGRLVAGLVARQSAYQAAMRNASLFEPTLCPACSAEAGSVVVQVPGLFAGGVGLSPWFPYSVPLQRLVDLERGLGSLAPVRLRGVAHGWLPDAPRRAQGPKETR